LTCIVDDEGVELSRVVRHPLALEFPTELLMSNSIGSVGMGACALVSCPICFPSKYQVID
jgi:hypothetical protein